MYEFQSPSGLTSGWTVYVRLRNQIPSNNEMWNISGEGSFENMASAHVADYAIPAPEQGSMGCYEGTFPTGIVFPGEYYYEMFRQVGGSPALSDSLIFNGTVHWAGRNATSFPLVDVALWLGYTPQGLSSSGLVPAFVVGGQGTGTVSINQDTGGTDNLVYFSSQGDGIGNANILIYLAPDWPNNPSNIQASSVTNADGTWQFPCYVDHGTYVAVFSLPGGTGPDVSAPFTV